MKDSASKNPHGAWKFLWGTATSAHQIEGYNQNSDWWYWEEAGNIEGGVRSGKATNHFTHWREDLQLLASLGHNSYRFSIEWAKLEPREGHWDLEAIRWYKELIAECEKLQILPMLTLLHFTLPQWLAEQGGVASPAFVHYFTRFTQKVLEELGAKIPLWCTLNEPMVHTMGSYIGKFMPPAVHNPQKAALASSHLLEAHVRAYDLIHQYLADRREGPWKEFPLQVGIAHNMFAVLPDRWWHPMERILAFLINRFYNQSWLSAITGGKQHFGLRGIIPKSKEVTSARGRKTADYLGLNYYTKLYIRWRPRNSDPENIPGIPIGISFARRNEPQSDMGWAIYPEGFRYLLRRLGKYKLPIYITENGIADKSDELREKYLRTHLQEIKSALEEGIDIRGYYYWSLLDNFEWSKGFGPRFGLVHVNYETEAREVRPSAYFYQEWIRNSTT